MLETEEKPRRALLLSVQLPSASDEEFESSLAELGALAKTLGVEVVGRLTQKRGSFDSGAYLGSGKREELRKLVGAPPPEKEGKKKRDDFDDSDLVAAARLAAHAAAQDQEAGDEEGEGDTAAADTGALPLDKRPDTLLVDHELTPSQARNLEKETGCDVLDRTAVILEIFHRHARSRAARAQVEIVRLEYMAPRLRETGKGKDRQRGGIGGKGAGESALELDRRKIRDRIAELTEELQQMELERKTQRARRAGTAQAAAGLERVALVGYTNAGKSTLMRALTGSEVYVADKLFATLDTTVRTLQPETVPRILVSDTVGFIKNLPHGLVASFKSTLEEALEATLLCHVIDASDAGWDRQRQVTEEVLDEIGAGEIPRLLAFNKIDRVADAPARIAELEERFPGCVILSARRPDDVAALREAFVRHFARSFVEEELFVPWSRQQLRGEIFSGCQVLGEESDGDGTRFRCRAPQAVLERLRKRLETM